jgi:D-xylose 1-dehydrogenase (NADP+, D-xylono-1,5-lactone-forming)
MEAMEQVRFAVLGTASVAAQRFIPALHASEHAVPAALAGRTLWKARLMAGELGVPRAYGRLDEALTDPEIDAVYICLPHDLHAEWAIRSLRAGKAVLCEKPLAVTAEQARQVEEESASCGLPVTEGLMYRYHPQNTLVRQLLAEGAIGDVQLARVHFSFPLVQQMHPDSLRPGQRAGAGALVDVGCYVVSAARFLLGDEPVSAAGVTLADEQLGIDTDFVGSLAFPRQRWAAISWSVKAGPWAGYSVVGSEGSLVVPHAFIPGVGGLSDETRVIRVRPDATRAETVFPPQDHFRLMIDAFALAVRGEAPLAYPAADARANAQALELVRAIR